MKKLPLLLILILIPSVSALSDFLYKDGMLAQQAKDPITKDMSAMVAKLASFELVVADQTETESREIAKEHLGKSCIIAFNRDNVITEVYNCRTTKSSDLSALIGKSSSYLQVGKDCDLSLEGSLNIDAKLSDDLRKTSPCTIKLLKDEYSGFSAGKFKLKDKELKSGTFAISKDGKVERATLFMTENKDLIFDETKHRLAKNTVLFYDERVSLDFSFKPASFELFSFDGKAYKSLGKIEPEGFVDVLKNSDGTYTLSGNLQLSTGTTIIKSKGRIFYKTKDDIIADADTDIVVFTKGKGGVRVETGKELVRITSCSKDISLNQVDFCKAKAETLRAKGKGIKVTEIDDVITAKGDLDPVGLRYGLNSRLLCAYNGIPDCHAKEERTLLIPGIGFVVKDGSITVKRTGKDDPSLIMEGSVSFSHELYTLAKIKESTYLAPGPSSYLPVKDAKLTFTGGGITGVVKEGVTCIGKKIEESCEGASIIIKPGKTTPAISTAAGDFGWPVSVVGMNYLFQCIHNGNDIDLALKENTPLYAIDDGIVTKVCSSDKKNCYCKGKECASGCGKCGLNGNHVEIESDINGKIISSLYIHMKTVKVKKGEIIRKGQYLGNSGNTGFSAGPHLHWRLSTADFGQETTNPLCIYDDKFLQTIIYKTGTALDCKRKSPCGMVNPRIKRPSIA